jgi:hypothetical protein
MTAMADALTYDLAGLEREILQSRILKRSLFPEDIGDAVVSLASSHLRKRAASPVRLSMSTAARYSVDAPGR